MKRYAPWFLIGAGVVVCLLGSGISDGIGGTVPRESGAWLVGGAMIVVGAGALVWQRWPRNRRRKP